MKNHLDGLLNNRSKGAVTEMIRARILTRYIIRIICGRNPDGDFYNEVVAMIFDRSMKVRHEKLANEDALPFSWSTWGRWYKGENSPNPTSISLLDAVFEGVASHWMRPSFGHVVTRNLTLMDILHKRLSLDLSSMLREFDAAMISGLELWYASKAGVDMPDGSFKAVNQDHNVGYRELRYMQHLNPGEPYSILRAFIAYLIETPESELYEGYEFDYVSICLMLYKHAEKFYPHIPAIPKGNGLNLVRSCMSHLFLGITEEESKTHIFPQHLENIARFISLSGIECGEEHLGHVLDQSKFRYYRKLAEWTGMTEKEIIVTLLPEMGF